MLRRAPALGLSIGLVAALAGPARADEPLLERYTYSGNATFFATGGALAIDGPDADTTNVDTLLHPGVTTISEADIPPGAILRRAFLYWGGSIPDNECSDASNIDDEVSFTPPGSEPILVEAEDCYCSDSGALNYDMQLCRANVTSLLGSLTGDYAVDEFDALIANGSTNTASFSVVLVYSDPDYPTRRIALYDGLMTLSSDNPEPSVSVSLGNIEVDDPAEGDLTWYVIEGDEGGSGEESVTVQGMPGGAPVLLADGINPADNPMNHTINTTDPQQTDALGVDIDQFSIDAAISPGDDTVLTTYSAGTDKYWLAYNIVAVNVFAPDFQSESTKTWTLSEDADEDGVPSPGDTIRYTISLVNQGNAPGTVDLEDPIPPEFESWSLVDAGGGVDLSLEETLVVEDIAVEVGGSTAVVVDMILAEVPDGTQVVNVANWAAQPDEGEGQLFAEPVVVVNPTAEDETGTAESTEDTETEGSTESEGSSGDESGSDGSGSSGDGADEVGGEATGADDAGVLLDDEGCGCSSAPADAPLRNALGIFALILGAGLVRRRASA